MVIDFLKKNHHVRYEYWLSLKPGSENPATDFFNLKHEFFDKRFLTAKTRNRIQYS